MTNIHKTDNRGFTIIELIVSMAIGIFIFGVLLKLFYVQRETFSIQGQLSEMGQNMRAAVDIMSRDIKMAGHGTTGTQIFVLSETGTITFLVDSDSDGTLETIRFALDDENLQIERKKDTNSPEPIVDNIESLVFGYGTNTDTGATNTVTIAVSGRTAKSDGNYMGDGYRRGTLTSIIKVRNQ